MKTCCKQYLTVLKRASNLGCKTSRKLVLGALKICLQNDGSVKVFKSSYTSWRPVFETDLQDVLQRIFNRLEKSKPTCGSQCWRIFVRPGCCDIPHGWWSRSPHRLRIQNTENNYSQLDKEALALVYAVKKFKQYLRGREFILTTDHKPLLGVLGEEKPVPDMASAKI